MRRKPRLRKPPREAGLLKTDNDAVKIQGTWVAASAEVDGKKAPADAIKDFAVIITAGKITFNPKGENRQAS